MIAWWVAAITFVVGSIYGVVTASWLYRREIRRHSNCINRISQSTLQNRIQTWFFSEPMRHMDLEYNQRELASRVWHWIDEDAT